MPSDNDTRSLKLLKMWSEAVQSVQSLDNGAYAFLKKTRAYVGNDGKIHVLLTDTFGLFVVDRPAIKSALAASVSQYLEKRFAENDVLFEQDNGKVKIEEDFSDLDEFMNN